MLYQSVCHSQMERAEPQKTAVASVTTNAVCFACWYYPGIMYRYNSLIMYRYYTYNIRLLLRKPGVMSVVSLGGGLGVAQRSSGA